MAIERAHGFRVVGPEGESGVVVAVRLSGQPPRPLALVVRDADCMRLVSARRIADVLSDGQTLLVTRDDGPARTDSDEIRLAPHGPRSSLRPRPCQPTPGHASPHGRRST
jgi:hypothetical protein